MTDSKGKKKKGLGGGGLALLYMFREVSQLVRLAISVCTHSMNGSHAAEQLDAGPSVSLICKSHRPACTQLPIRSSCAVFITESATVKGRLRTNCGPLRTAGWHEVAWSGKGRYTKLRAGSDDKVNGGKMPYWEGQARRTPLLSQLGVLEPEVVPSLC